jgi:hypothetical protein
LCETFKINRQEVAKMRVKAKVISSAPSSPAAHHGSPFQVGVKEAIGGVEK